MVGAMAAAAVPGLRTPWLLSTASLIATVGILGWVTAGTASTVFRVYLPLAGGLAISSGVDEATRGGSIRSGLARAGVTAVVCAGLIAIVELSDWRTRATARVVPDPEQRPNDR